MMDEKERTMQRNAMWLTGAPTHCIPLHFTRSPDALLTTYNVSIEQAKPNMMRLISVKTSHDFNATTWQLYVK